MTIYNDNIARPYVYKLTHKITGQFYYGYREANICAAHDDIGVQYFTSSEKIHELGFNKFSDISHFNVEILSEFTEADVININIEDTPGDAAWDNEQDLIENSWGDPLLLNGNVCLRESGRVRFKLKKGFKRTLEMCLRYAGENSYAYGKNWEEMYGSDLAADMREKRSKKSGIAHHFYGITGVNHPAYGRKHTPDEIAKQSGENNYMFGLVGDKHPRYGIKRPEHSKAMLGENHPLYDPTEYNWYNTLLDVKETCTKLELYNIHKTSGINMHGLSRLIRHEIHSHRGWTLISD